MSHNSFPPVDIARAVANDRKIKFVRFENGRLWYSTAFNENFWIHHYWVPSQGIGLTARALDFQPQMEHFNNNHSTGGS